MTTGCIYILINAAMPGYLKIGMTTRSPQERAQELSQSSGIATPFVVAFSEEVTDCTAAEELLHRRLTRWRVTERREFFHLELQSAIRQLTQIADKVGRPPPSATSQEPTPIALDTPTANKETTKEFSNAPPVAEPEILSVQDTARCGNPDTRDYHFRSLGHSAFVAAVRKSLTERANTTDWHIGGDSSLTAVYLPSTNAIAGKWGRGLSNQLWLPRPGKGKADCTFEVAYAIPSLDKTENETLRMRLATSIRTHLIRTGLPEGIQEARKSTVIKCRLILPHLINQSDDTPANAERHVSEIQRIVDMLKFLDSTMPEWVNHGLQGQF
jgi:hypothetical protein